jgi:DNA-binding SARP family transcriptional activator
LPQSKKARALLGYLVLTRRAHRRERLASLFWDVADDARGALRWTLSRVRAAIDAPPASRIIADRDEVHFDLGEVEVDRFVLSETLARGLEQASISELEAAAARFRGELLEGDDLPDFFEFTAWLSAEREEARRSEQQLLSALCRRLDDPERALPYARTRVRIDPLDEAAGTTLVGLLLRAGRRAEAEEHCESVARLIESVGQPNGRLLAALRLELNARRETKAPARPARVRPRPEEIPASSSQAVPFVGRARELLELERARTKALAAERPAIVLVSGDPGIGKSRLLSELVRRYRSEGAEVHAASAFEADRNLPFLAWRELLRAFSSRELDADLRRGLSPLLPELAAVPDVEVTRESLFRAVTRVLTSAPVLVFDDAHWLDDASAALLHHVLRALAHRPLVCLLGVRRGELADNPAVVSLLRGARSDRVLSEVELGPLSEAEVTAVVRGADPSRDPLRVVAESEGNPLFALELARFTPEPGSELPRTLREIVADRVERLPRASVELVQWAAALGGHCEVEVLAALTRSSSEELLRTLELLERHAFLRAAADADGKYVFSHELAGRAVYLGISEPRRKLMHRRIAEVLSSRGLEAETMNDVSRHAALGGDSALASQACLRAAERCLRVFANDEARAFAQRGLRHVSLLDEARRIPLEIQLRCTAVLARRPTDVEATVATLHELAERALDLGRLDDARAAYRMISILRWEVGRLGDAERASTWLENLGRAGDVKDRARAMGEAGHCLALLERDLPRAEALLLEAKALATKASLRLYGVNAGLAVLGRYRGETAEALALFVEARALARLDGDRAYEFDALTHIVELAYQSGDLDRAERVAAELEELGEKLREGSEPAFSRGLHTLVRYRRGDASALAEFETALAEIRTKDASLRLATLLLHAGELELAHDPGRARFRAEEAERLGIELQRENDIIVARVLALRAAQKLGESDPARAAQLSAFDGAVPGNLSARAKHALSLIRSDPSRAFVLEQELSQA